jgi:hypothetical protein
VQVCFTPPGVELPGIGADRAGALWLACQLQTFRGTNAVENGMAESTWKPHTKHGDLSDKDRDELPASAFAFPKERKEPLTDASHVQNALARFDPVEDVSDAQRDQAWANIKKAAKHFDVDIAEDSWHDLGKKPHTANRSH